MCKKMMCTHWKDLELLWGARRLRVEGGGGDSPLHPPVDETLPAVLVEYLILYKLA